MAINFPSNPSNGAIFTDPSGQQWVYNSSDKSWTGLGISVNPGGLQYQGGLNITSAPPTAQSGEFWSVETGGTANAGFGPGVTGTIPTGSFVLYDGVNWELLETSSLWNRTGGLIQPVNQNDVIQTDSGLKVGPSGTPTITLNADGTYVGKKSVSVDRTATSNPTFRGKLNGADTFKVLADGSAEFAGLLKADTIRPLNADSAAAPGLAVYNDPDTGFYRPSSNNIGISTGGVERVRVNSTGLLVGGTLPSSPNISLNGDGSADFSGNVGIGTDDPKATLHVKSDSIGIPGPGVAGSMQVGDGNGFGLMLGCNGSGVGYIQPQRNNGTTTTFDLLLSPNGGNVGIGTDNPSSLLHLAANAPYITFEDKDNNQDWQIRATSWFALRNQNNNSELLRVNPTGEVGIGTTNPQATLDVNGSAQFAGSVSIGGTAAANTIDEYEEGTWTATVTLDNGSTPATHVTTSSARYRRIGATVTCYVQVVLDADIAQTGFRFALPFTAGAAGSCSLVNTSNMSGGTMNGFVQGTNMRCGFPADLTSGSKTYRGSFTYAIN
jgi:hypothetical protein